MLTKIGSGEVDAGIVERSTAKKLAPKVALLGIDKKINVTIRYSAVTLKGGDADAAKAFVQFLASDKAKVALTSAGYLP